MLKDEDCNQSSQELIDYLSLKIKELESKIALLVRQDKALNENFKRLKSIPAIGDITAYWLLAYLASCGFKNGKEAATFFGLTPMSRQSGSSVYTVCGISKIGHSYIRKALYAPAMNFAFGRWKNSVYLPFVERLLANGKAKKVVIVALMRKIVTIAFAVRKTQKYFDLALI
ncbi:MAG: IS110 family transposase [Neisseriaceae bacterium]|nr:IS110 family transposase [Neisseriaceae bacterium]